MAIEADGVVKRKYGATRSSSAWRKPRMGWKPVSVLTRVPTAACSTAIDLPSSRVRYEPVGWQLDAFSINVGGGVTMTFGSWVQQSGERVSGLGAQEG